MRFWTLLIQILQSVFTCSHTRARVVEGKTYCPDCGRGVIFRWVVLRCRECGQRRASRYCLRQVVPMEPCCTACGTQAIVPEVLENPAYYQLRHALLQYQMAPDETTILTQAAMVVPDFFKHAWQFSATPSLRLFPTRKHHLQLA